MNRAIRGGGCSVNRMGLIRWPLCLRETIICRFPFLRSLCFFRFCFSPSGSHPQPAMAPRASSPRRPAHERRRSHTRGGGASDRSPAASNGTPTAALADSPSPPPPLLQPATTNSIIVQEYHGSEAVPACYRFSSHDQLARLEHDSEDRSTAASASASAGNLSFLRRWLAALVAVFTSLFLPVGYPASVTPDYFEFQCWDTLQAMSSYLRGMLCTHAVLTGLGVGEASASATSATVNWVLRDGLGMFGSLLFAAWGSGGFGLNIQAWRLFADVINDVGLTLELVSPLFPRDYFFLFLVGGCLCRSLCGVAAGSTRAALMQHFARVGNMADLAAKEGSQETFVTLLGMVGGALLMRWIDGDTRSTWILFGALTALHVYANWRGVRALVLCTLNPQRTDLLLRDFCTQLLGGLCRAPRLLIPSEVAQRERLIWTAGAAREIRLGASLHSVVGSAQTLAEILAAQHHPDNADYILCPTEGGAVEVVLRAKQAPPSSSDAAVAASGASSSSSASSDLTMLRALFHAHLYRAMLQRGDGTGAEQTQRVETSSLQTAVRCMAGAITPRFLSSSAAAASPRTSALSAVELRTLRTSGILCARQWPIVLGDLTRHGWTLEHLALDNEGWRCHW